MHSAAILLSRQPLRPSGNTPWIKHAIKAVQWVKENADCLYASTGMQTWELLVTLAQQNEITQKIVVPSEDEIQFKQQCDYIFNQFNLNRNRVEFIPVLPDNSGLSLQKLRDEHIIANSDILIPVSVREKGHMQSLLNIHAPRKKIIIKFYCPYSRKSTPIAYTINDKNLNPQIREIADTHLIHWTRTSNSAWPTEKLIDYYSDIINADSFPRNAFNTLQNILGIQRIVSSSAHMPANIPTVSFSGTLPEYFLPLMRYRARYRQMSFEPYGIGVEKKYAQSIGIKPVCYYDRSEKNHLDASEEWLMQSSGVKSDWRKEDEYRHLGNLDLSKISRNKLLCFCYITQEATMLELHYSIKTISFLTRQ